MKQFFPYLILALSFGFFFTSCSEDDTNNYYVSEVYDINVTSWTKKDNYSYYFYQKFKLDYLTDNLLIYRQAGITNSGNPVWELLPAVYYNTYGSYTYYFDFSAEDYFIYLDADYNIMSNTPEILANQTFRIVIIPGDYATYSTSGTKTTPVDYHDYNAVIKYYHIDDSKVRELK